KGPVHHRPHPAVAVRRPAVRHRADLLQHRLVVGATIAPFRARPADVVGGAPGDPEDRTDRRHRMRRHRPGSLRNDGVFFTTSWAARKISTSMVLRPSARSRSRILAYASRNWLAGTTSSLAWTAVVAPASANRFQLRMTLGKMSSSRLSPAKVFSPVRIRGPVVRLNSVLNPRRPSAFRRCSPMGPPAASYVPTVSSRNGEHSNVRLVSSATRRPCDS